MGSRHDLGLPASVSDAQQTGSGRGEEDRPVASPARAAQKDVRQADHHRWPTRHSNLLQCGLLRIPDPLGVRRDEWASRSSESSDRAGLELLETADIHLRALEHAADGLNAATHIAWN